MRIAITGSIGSGKSEVGKIFTSMGYIVIDTDRLAAEVLKRGTDVYGLLVEAYGVEILDPDGNIDKKYLANLIFTNEHEKKRVEAWMHPAIWQLADNLCAKFADEKFIFVEVPLLFETNSQGRFDRSLLIITDPEIALERLMKNRKIEREEAFRRWRNQMDPALKMEMADDVIVNNASLNELNVLLENYVMKLETLH
ncbi:MAG: dephospho-CoA kinase [Erysipelotrichaceae bacterium]